MVAAPGFGKSYEIIRLLGEGGMGRVYLARETALSRLVAIKVLIAAQGEDKAFQDRFQEEARICAALKHRNIVRLFSSGVADGAPFMVFEFIEGSDLKRELSLAGSLPWTTVNDLACGVLQGLECAHDLGIVHRDIKPANILLRAQSGEPMLMDFGVAKAQAGRRVTTMPGVLLGTVGYIAPELFGGAEPSPASDLYSLGGTLYEALTGKHPFEGGSDLDVIQRQLKGSLPSPTSLCAGVPDALSNVVLRALAREPGHRFGSAREMRAAIEGATGRLAQSSVAISPVDVPVARTPRASGAVTTQRSRPSSATRAITSRPIAAAGQATAVVSTALRPRRGLHVFAGCLLALGLAAAGQRGWMILRADPPTNVSVIASDDGSLEVRWNTRFPGRGGLRIEAQRAGAGVKTSTSQEPTPGVAHRVRIEELEPGAPCTFRFLTEAGDITGTRTVAIPDCDQLQVTSTAESPPRLRVVLPEGDHASATLSLLSPGARTVTPTKGPDGRLEFSLPGHRVADLAGAHVEVRMGPEVVARLHPTASRRMVERLIRKLDKFDEGVLIAKAVRDPRFGDYLDREFAGRVILPDQPFFALHKRRKASAPLRSGTFREFLKSELRERGLFDELEAFRAVAASFFGDPGVSDDSKRALYARLLKLTYLDLLVATQHDLDSPRYRDLTEDLVRHTHALDPRAHPPGPAPGEVSLLDRPLAWVPRDFQNHFLLSLWAGSHEELQRLFKLGSDSESIAAALVRTPQKVAYPASMRDRDGALISLRMRVAYLGAGYLYRVTIRGKEGRGFTVLLTHPGTADWYRAMDGETDKRQPPDAPAKSGGGWIAWGELSATFPARLLPEKPSTLEIEHLSLPGVAIGELNPDFERAAFVRELTLRADDPPATPSATGRTATRPAQ